MCRGSDKRDGTYGEVIADDVEARDEKAVKLSDSMSSKQNSSSLLSLSESLEESEDDHVEVGEYAVE